ncbi:MAG: glycosyltransferase [Cyanobacteria bacterium CRU_2_1]|nr:glycosyltransferase [Cyanobacteria bacterium RU_5_0]NJR60188.1 glycosyltransferase [Cyanobacteria bacterium CRU_2_1]
MSQSPGVSVLMAVYNTEQYVAQAIESILNQTFLDFELIIIDDGSTDRSLKILQTYAAEDQRIRITSRENRGIPKTRNEMVAQSSGEFIAVMDSDDVALPDRLTQQVKFLHQNPETVWVGGAFELIDEKRRLITQIPLPEQDHEIRQLLQNGHTSFLHPTAMMRRSAVLAVGGYDETLPLAEDLDLWFKLSQVGGLANLKDAVVQYRLHPGSICDRHRAAPPPALQIALDRAWEKGIIKERIQATTVCGWRPGIDRVSRHDFMLRYGWWAFNSRQRGTAFVYGTRALTLNPFSPQGWKLLSCAALKPLPKGDLS